MDIKAKIESLSIGDKVKVNDWTEYMEVCGVSENFVLAHNGDEYTIIGKKPVDFCYNNIPVGSFVCGPDNYLFGYGEGYDFDNGEWAQKYLSYLENGEMEISMRRRAHITSLDVLEA